MNLKLNFLTSLLLLVLVGVINIEALKCYVCGDDGELPCKDFDISKDSYAKECDSSDNHKVTCFKKTEGTKVTRGCQVGPFNQCELANGVEYCYCPSDLCNDNISKFGSPTDDEDLLEGSGIKTIPTATEETTVRINTPSASVKVYFSKLMFTVLIIAFLHK